MKEKTTAHVFQQDQTNHSRVLILLIILLIAAAAFRMMIAFCDMRTLVTKVLSDDSFYYFQLAKNAAAGRGVSFDGVVPANGFHPLWFALLLPLFRLFGGSLNGPIHAALVLEGLLDVGAGLFIFLLVKRLTQNSTAGLLGATVYLLNPSVLFHSVNGLETGLNLFLFALYFWFYLSSVHKNALTLKTFLALGVLSGLLMLARTDNAIIVAITYLHLLFVRKEIRRPHLVLLSGATAAIVVAPWLLWNLHTFGTIEQASGNAYSIITRGNLHARGITGFQIFLTSLSNTITLFVYTIPVDVFGWGGLMGILAGLAVGATLLDEDKARPTWAAVRLACVPLVAFVALALAHSLMRGTLKSWYFIPAATVASIFLGILCGPYDFSRLLKDRRGKLAAAFLAVVVLSGYSLNGYNGWKKGMYPWQTEQLMAAEWVKKNIADDEWVGGFNSGIIGYMSEKKVINLDGLANNSVVPYLRERRLWDYIKERKISYLVDSDYSILRDYRDFYGQDWEPRKHLVRVAVIDDPAVSWAGSQVGAYKVIP